MGNRAMRTLLTLAFVVVGAPVWAQVQPNGYPSGVTPPIFGNPSAVSGGGAASASLIPTADNTYDLGSSSFRWKDLWLGGSLNWSDVSLSRGAANVLTLASGDMLSFGGVTNGVPALKPSGAILTARLGDDSANASFEGASLRFSTSLSTNSVGILASTTAPTVTSAGTSPSVTAHNGTAAFRVNVGTGGTATTIVMAMPTAATGWNCDAENITAAAANRANQTVKQQASTTTSVTVQNQTVSTGAALAFTASDIVRFICVAF